MDSSTKLMIFMVPFIVVTAILSAIIGSGALLKITNIDQGLNATQLFLQQTKLEQEQEIRQNAYENSQRDEQRYAIVNDTNKSLNQLKQDIIKFINESENRSIIANTERQKIIDTQFEIDKNVDQKRDEIRNQLLNISKNLDSMLKQSMMDNKKDFAGADKHRKLSVIQNVTLNEILDDIQKILESLKNKNNSSNSN